MRWRDRNTTYGAMIAREILKPLGMAMSGTAFTDAMCAHLAPGHDVTGRAAENWNFDALAGAGAILSTANDMLRYLKANMGIDHSPLAAAMKLAQWPRNDTDNAMRIGLAWVTTDQGIVWHNGATGGYRSFLGFTPNGGGASSSSPARPWTPTISVSPHSMRTRRWHAHLERSDAPGKASRGLAKDDAGNRRHRRIVSLD